MDVSEGKVPGVGWGLGVGGQVVGVLKHLLIYIDPWPNHMFKITPSQSQHKQVLPAACFLLSGSLNHILA